jgi:hypothetical protein
MAIMFAGGMAIGVPSFMPEAASDLSVTEGLLTVSSTEIQGAAILEIVVNDPDYSDTTVDISDTPQVDFKGTSYDLNQAVNGKWYVYIVDNSQSVLLDQTSTAGASRVNTGQEFGIKCVAGVSINESTTDLIVPAATGDLVGAWVAVLEQGSENWSHSTAVGDGDCLNADGMIGVADSGTTQRQDLTAVVLTGAPSLSNHDDTALGTSTIDMGQRGHVLMHQDMAHGLTSLL